MQQLLIMMEACITLLCSSKFPRGRERISSKLQFCHVPSECFTSPGLGYGADNTHFDFQQVQEIVFFLSVSSFRVLIYPDKKADFL